MVTVDLVVFTLLERTLRVLLVRRRGEPFAGRWAIPGGFLEMDEAAEAGARRELREETGLNLSGPVTAIGFFDKPGRDPRGRTITLAHAAVLAMGDHRIQGGDDAAEAAWIKVGDPVELAFDHDEILKRSLEWLRRGVVEWSGGLALEIWPGSFQVDDVRALFLGVGMTYRQADSWLEKMRRMGRLERRGDAGGRSYQVKPTSQADKLREDTVS